MLKKKKRGTARLNKYMYTCIYVTLHICGWVEKRWNSYAAGNTVYDNGVKLYSNAGVLNYWQPASLNVNTNEPCSFVKQMEWHETSPQ